MAFYATRHWQTPCRLVQKLNICTVYRLITGCDLIITHTICWLPVHLDLRLSQRHHKIYIDNPLSGQPVRTDHQCRQSLLLHLDEFKMLLLTFKCMQGCAPLYLRELLVKQANTRTLRSNTKNLLQIPLTNLKRFGERAFCAYAPRLWNEPPDNIKAADIVQNFKKQLKTMLFRKEFI